MTRGAVSPLLFRRNYASVPARGVYGSGTFAMSPYEDGILRSLRRISRALDLYSRQLATRVGLTGPQLVCMRHIHRNGAMTPSRLSREVHLSQATVTGIVDRLVAGGWVVRKRSETDRRLVTVELTEAAHVLLLSAPSPLQDRFSERLSALPDAEQAAILRSLERVVAMMDAENLPPRPIEVDAVSSVAHATEIVLDRVVSDAETKVK